jgi:CTP:molybdopterin cytidylyltransferase MocA
VTVAAVILAAAPESALADADGVPRVRRMADAAWSGGALPVVVVSFDPDGQVAAALAGAEVTLAEPVPGPDGVPVAQMRRGIDVARGIVSGIDGAFIWPARMGWVSPETITSMIEAHGLDTAAVLRPSFDGEAGWPVLLPLAGIAGLAAVAPDRMPDGIIADVIAGGLASRLLDLGDPGTTHDGSIPSSMLPAYVGPSEPVATHRHEWGSEIADAPEDAPLEGPARVPYPPA